MREWDDTPADFGRIAAMTAKQVIMQRLREATDDVNFGEYAGMEGDIVTGVIQADGGRAEKGIVVVDLGRIEAILPHVEQVPGEDYSHGRRLRASVVQVTRGARRPQITLSRTHPNLVRKLFAMEVPEIADGTVEIAAVAREAGHRTKIAVRATVPDLNAKGACIGPMGARVRAVMSELDGEKIDIIDYSDDPDSSSGMHCLRRRSSGHRSSTWTTRLHVSWFQISNCRWLSAEKGRTPDWRHGLPGGVSTSSRTPRPTPTVVRTDQRPTLRPSPRWERAASTLRGIISGGPSRGGHSHLCGLPYSGVGHRVAACRCRCRR